MADDGSFELEDGELVVASAVNGPSSTADDLELLAQLHEAVTVLRHRGQENLARLAIGLVEAHLRDAMWVLDDQVRGGGGGELFSGDPALLDTFRHMIRGRLLSLQEVGYDEHVISQAFPSMVLETAQLAARQLVLAGGAAPASAAAVCSRSLEKQTFCATGGNDDDGVVMMECSICFEDFVDGDQVSVMPCPCGVHRFHSDCISKWLAVSNMCPLCRHELPPAYYYE